MGHVLASYASSWKVGYTSTDMLELFALSPAMVLMSLIMPVKICGITFTLPAFPIARHTKRQIWLPPWLPIYTSCVSLFPNNSGASKGKRRGGGEKGKDIRDTCHGSHTHSRQTDTGHERGKRAVFIFPDQVSGQHLCGGLTPDLWKWQSFIWASRRRSGANRYVCNTHRPQS